MTFFKLFKFFLISITVSIIICLFFFISFKNYESNKNFLKKTEYLFSINKDFIYDFVYLKDLVTLEILIKKSNFNKISSINNFNKSSDIENLDPKKQPLGDNFIFFHYNDQFSPILINKQSAENYFLKNYKNYLDTYEIKYSQIIKNDFNVNFEIDTTVNNFDFIFSTTANSKKNRDDALIFIKQQFSNKINSILFSILDLNFDHISSIINLIDEDEFCSSDLTNCSLKKNVQDLNIQLHNEFKSDIISNNLYEIIQINDYSLNQTFDIRIIITLLFLLLNLIIFSSLFYFNHYSIEIVKK